MGHRGYIMNTQSNWLPYHFKKQVNNDKMCLFRQKVGQLRLSTKSLVKQIKI